MTAKCPKHGRDLCPDCAIDVLTHELAEALRARNAALSRVDALAKALRGYYDGECHCDEPGVVKPCVGCEAKAALEGCPPKCAACRSDIQVEGNSLCDSCAEEISGSH